jgi:hypothetical protein
LGEDEGILAPILEQVLLLSRGPDRMVSRARFPGNPSEKDEACRENSVRVGTSAFPRRSNGAPNAVQLE